MTRERAPRETFNTAVAAFLPFAADVVADCNDILNKIQIEEMKEEGLQFEQQAQKARAIRRMMTEVQELLHKIARGIAAEEQLNRSTPADATEGR